MVTAREKKKLARAVSPPRPWSRPRTWTLSLTAQPGDATLKRLTSAHTSICPRKGQRADGQKQSSAWKAIVMMVREGDRRYSHAKGWAWATKAGMARRPAVEEGANGGQGDPQRRRPALQAFRAAGLGPTHQVRPPTTKLRGQQPGRALGGPAGNEAK
ncbi:MAG: hypothetical protein M1821_001940 [Bathelium mastoideum]|nr:MAG: hypothetical protein M1821_001940 [Bathelium mastoideum]KAI9692449.1 MAG: hypothetical protein M1822_006680 [Bathelium mastoideum]